MIAILKDSFFQRMGAGFVAGIALITLLPQTLGL